MSRRLILPPLSLIHPVSLNFRQIAPLRRCAEIALDG